jgi:AraC-like DNA-binding protein
MKLDENALNRYMEQLEFYMQNHKPYLIPTISINELAAKTTIPARHLSQVINEKLNKNFFDFINKYRVEEAKRLLSQNISEKETILKIAFESGFNSKSTFNSIFKKFVNMTPSQYQKKFTAQ